MTSTPNIQKIVFLGAGRLAVNLATALHRKGYDVAEIYNRTESRGSSLARKLGARFISRPELVTPGADLYILAVSDAAIPEVIERISFRNRLIVHTSGSVNMNVLQPVSTETGVIYPPQTFTGTSLKSFRTVPLCLEASSPENLFLLRTLADSVSDHVYILNSGQRKILHLSAVFANNFTNFILAVSRDLLEENGMDFRILEPLIRKTAASASSGDVFALQTGPAVREDLETIREHLAMLSNHDDYREIYELMTKNIIQRKNKK